MYFLGEIEKKKKEKKKERERERERERETERERERERESGKNISQPTVGKGVVLLRHPWHKGNGRKVLHPCVMIMQRKNKRKADVYPGGPEAGDLLPSAGEGLPGKAPNSILECWIDGQTVRIIFISLN